MQNILDTPDATLLPWQLEVKMEDGRVLQQSARLAAAFAKDQPALAAYVGGFVKQAGKQGAVKEAVFTILNPQGVPMGRWRHTQAGELVAVD